MTRVVPRNESGTFNFLKCVCPLQKLFASRLRLHQICEGHRLLTLRGQKGSELQAARASTFPVPRCSLPRCSLSGETIQSSCMLRRKPTELVPEMLGMILDVFSLRLNAWLFFMRVRILLKQSLRPFRPCSPRRGQDILLISLGVCQVRSCFRKDPREATPWTFASPSPTCCCSCQPLIPYRPRQWTDGVQAPASFRKQGLETMQEMVITDRSWKMGSNSPDFMGG